MGSRLSSPTALTAVIAIAMAGALSTPAFADTASTVRQVTFSDLDLSSQADAKQLLRRIHVAARAACQTDFANSSLFPRSSAEQRQCVTEATDSAVKSVNAPLLAQANRDTPIALASR